MAGGCCGTTPEFIKAVSERMKGVGKVREVGVRKERISMYSGQ
jgi:hypothetical protein